jgi:hypothetical protein
MYKQEMFNIAITKLWEQGVQCTNKDGNCIYHNDLGHRCAVGWLLSEEVATKYAYSGCVRELIYTAGDELPSYIKQNMDFLNQLQLVHDVADPVHFRESMMSRAQRFAENHNLTLPILV